MLQNVVSKAMVPPQVNILQNIYKKRQLKGPHVCQEINNSHV